MSRGNSATLKQMYVADFETCDSNELYKWNIRGGLYNQRVWLAGLMNLENLKPMYFTNLDDFMVAILSRGDNTNREYGFHNLKFDGSYVIPWLLNNGFVCVHHKPISGQFSVLIDDRNNWYSIRVQVTNKRRITLWDTLKLFPTSLEYLPNIYGTPTRKGIEDQDFYNLKRPLDHEPTEKEIGYMYKDLKVLAETLNKHIEYYGLRFKKTQASQSFYNFEQSFKAWKLRFPGLSDKVDKDIRPAYWGGISHVSYRYQGMDMYDIDVYDINSSYPYQLAYQRIPYGKETSFGSGVKPDMSKFWVAEALAIFKLKGDKIPCIPSRSITENRPINAEHWVSDSKGLVRIVFCSIDYYTMLDSYDLEIVSWEWHICWAQKVHPELTRFIEKNNEDKTKYRELANKTSDPVLKGEYLAHSQRAKIDNNAFYGKFGEDIEKYGKSPHLTEDNDIEYKIDRYELLTLWKRKFLPVAIATTAWGRYQLVKLANLLGKEFIYCDTDSLHVTKKGSEIIKELANTGKIILDPLELGAWDKEGSFDRGRFLRSKCYYEQNEGEEAEVTLAGLPADPHSGPRSKKRSVITWDNFHIGLYIPAYESNKLGSRRTKTGNKLVPVGFEITKKTDYFFRKGENNEKK